MIVTRFPYEAQITSSGINQKEEGQIEEIIKNMTKKNHTVPTSQIRFHICLLYTSDRIIDKNDRYGKIYLSQSRRLPPLSGGE